MIHFRQISSKYRGFRQILKVFDEHFSLFRFQISNSFKGYDHKFADANDFFSCSGGQWWSISDKFRPDTEELDRFCVMAKGFKGYDHEFSDANDFFPGFGGQCWSILDKFRPDTEDLDSSYHMATGF